MLFSFQGYRDSFVNNISKRFLKQKDSIKSIKCLLSTGKTPNQAEKSLCLKLLELYKNYIPLQMLTTATV